MENNQNTEDKGWFQIAAETGKLDLNRKDFWRDFWAATVIAAVVGWFTVGDYLVRHFGRH